MGTLKAKVGGVWVPVGTPGPAGAPGAAGPPGTAAAKAKARGFNANFSNGGGILQGGIMSGLTIGTIQVNDGFTKISPTSVRTNVGGRFLIQACVTVYGGASGNWMIFQIEHRQYSNSAVLGTYDVVAQNTSTGYHMAANAVTVDAGDDYFSVKLQPDASPGPYLDDRSWFSISEVAW